MVFVLDRRGRPLMPCTEKRARLLLERGRAVVCRLHPFTIRLKDRLAEHSALQPCRLTHDPGFHSTGAAVVREEKTPQGPVYHALHLGVIHHRQEEVRSRILKRRQARRRGRSSLRHRVMRFGNRRRPDGWLPPSLRSRVDNVASAARLYIRLAPITAIDVELTKFDTQRLQNPEISGVEYQRGELFGYEVRECLLEKWGRRCAYCGAEGVPTGGGSHRPPVLGRDGPRLEPDPVVPPLQRGEGKQDGGGIRTSRSAGESEAALGGGRGDECHPPRHARGPPASGTARAWRDGCADEVEPGEAGPPQDARRGCPLRGGGLVGHRVGPAGAGYPGAWRGTPVPNELRRLRLPEGAPATEEAGVRVLHMAQGISWRHLCLLQRFSGYSYGKEDEAPSSPWLKPGASGVAKGR